MAVSQSALIPRVRTFLNDRPYVTTGTAANAADLTIDVTDGTRWEEGAIGEFQDTGDQFYVQSVAGNVLTVIRGWNGTTAAAHSSITLFRDPTYFYKDINEALTAALNGLWPYVWKKGEDTITPSSTTVWFDLDAAFVDLISATQRYGASNEYIGTYGGKNTGRPIIVSHNLPTAVVASGKGARFPNGFFHNSNTVEINYRTPITGTSDIEDSATLPVAEAMIYGALARLLTGKEVERISYGEDVEVARGVNPGQRMRVSAYYENLYREKLQMLKLNHEMTIKPQPKWAGP